MKRGSFLLFLIGVFSMTQLRIIGSVGISELFMFAIAPFVYIKNRGKIIRDGFYWVSLLLILTIIGGVFSSICNETELPFAIKGIATPYAIWASFIVLHGLIRKDLSSIKFFIIGAFLSTIINIFIFQTGTNVGLNADLMSNADRIEKVVNRPLFFANRVGGGLLAISSAFYFSVPVIYTIFAECMSGLLGIFLSEGSGRSGFMMSVVAAGIIAVGRKKYQAMRIISRNILMWIILALIMAIGFKYLYRYAATNNILGEKATKKYELQTRGGDSISKLLISGRVDFFVGLYACCKKPILGFGPWAIDNQGYYSDFLRKYGAEEDYEDFEALRLRAYKEGGDVGRLLAGHSHIIGWWLWYGVFGLIFWLYILRLIYLYFTRYLTAIPQWYCYLAASMPIFVWAIFFSPVTARVGTAATLCALLFARAVGEHRLALPVEMHEELIHKNFWS